MMILTKDIKEFCRERKEALRQTVSEMEKPPILAVIQVGDVEASTRYIKNKKKDCEEVGITFEWYYYKTEEVTTEYLVQEIQDLCPFVDGLIVQLPLPNWVDVSAIKTAIDPKKDVDGFHPMTKFYPCTPLGIIEYLYDGCEYDFVGKNITVIGRSDIVGKPLAKLLTDLNATVSLCHSQTKPLEQYIYHSDMIICAVGKPKFLNCYSIHVPVIDVGINFDENGKLCGDCFNTENRDVTPVPGGVGLLTRLALLENTVNAAKGIYKVEY